MATLTQSRHIEFDDRGRPWLKGANTKVLEVVLSHVAYGWSAESLHDNYPHLSLAEVYAALAYYYDNKEEMDRAMDDDHRRVEDYFHDQRQSPAVQKLRQLKHNRQHRSS